MTLIKMKQTRMGTEDGFAVRQFVNDRVYDVRESLARQFFAAGVAEKPSAIETVIFGFEQEMAEIMAETKRQIDNTNDIMEKSINEALVTLQNQEALKSGV